MAAQPQRVPLRPASAQADVLANTARRAAMGHRHRDGEPDAERQAAWLDEILRLAHARYGDFNPERVRQLADHLTIAESHLTALYTETPYVNLADYAPDDPRRIEAITIRENGYDGWRRLHGG